MKYLPEIIAFLCGAVVMILELDGSRIIAPYLGTSTIVWTGLIGVILGSLSLGYWWGGRIADRSANFETLGKVLAVAAVATLSIAYLKNLLELAALAPQNLIAMTVIGTIVLFTPATVCLGIITPYVARLKMKNVEKSGETIGSLYALSTLGSIIGTFLGGFVLISFLGSTKIIMILSSCLFLLAAGSFWNTAKPFSRRLALICVIAAGLVLTIKTPNSFGVETIKDVDTRYSRVWIQDGTDTETGRPVRYLTNSKYGTQSGMFLDEPNELLFQYTKLFDLAETLYPDFKKTLMIGAGAYSYPKHFLETYKNASMDVVEIDSGLTELAKQYFGFKENPRVKIFHEDGRTFLNNSQSKYNVVWNDAFLSYLNIPFQLTTKEVVQKMYDALNLKGVVMTNLISPVSGKALGFLSAEYATYKKVFPAVFLIKVTKRPEAQMQNIMLVAWKSPEGHLPLKILETKFDIPEKNIFVPISGPDTEVLTDEFAPIEKYMAEMLL